MRFSRLVVAAVALSVAAALPAPCETEEHNASQTVDAKSSSHAELVAKPTSHSKAPPAPPKKASPPAPPKKAAPAPPKKASPPPPPPSNGKASNGKGSKKTPPPPPAKNNNNKGSKTSSAAAASKATPPPNTAVNLPPPKNTATDSGVAGVILGCDNPDGVDGCFEILNVLGSCFSIPHPLANNVSFFLPAPPVAGVPSVCTLFTDQDCQDGGIAGAGQVSQIGQNSFICNATSTSTTTTTTTTTTSEAAANTAVNLPPSKNTATDSGVKGVIESCVNPDGVTECFQILNVLGSCFSIPRPLANNVGFFLPPPPTAGVPAVCTLFSDENCQDGGIAGAGQVSQVGQNSFICNATSTSTTTTTTTTTTSEAAANTAVNLPPPKNTATDSGVTGVIEGCVNPDGVTECFQILNVLGSCFSIPSPLANNVGFFLPPPPTAGVPAVCTLFSDEDCLHGPTPGAGQVSNVQQNSFICNATTAAA